MFIIKLGSSLDDKVFNYYKLGVLFIILFVFYKNKHYR